MPKVNVQISKKGVFDKDGKEIPVGTKLSVDGGKDGKTIPKHLVHKCTLVDTTAPAVGAEAQPVTNPANQTPSGTTGAATGAPTPPPAAAPAPAKYNLVSRGGGWCTVTNTQGEPVTKPVQMTSEEQAAFAESTVEQQDAFVAANPVA